MPEDNNKPWYREGLRFECTGCGDCCTGAPGYVWVNEDEIEALAQVTGMDVATFEDTFVRRVGQRKSLIEYPGGDCVFFDPTERKCNVYEHRPRQCRTWPFWPSNVATPSAWRQTCRNCPGAGQGKLVPLDEIQRQIKVIRI